MRVLGIDCGTERTGWGVIESDGRRHSVVGHGIQFSEVERRTLRLERHLGLPPLEPEGRIL